MKKGAASKLGDVQTVDFAFCRSIWNGLFSWNKTFVDTCSIQCQICRKVVKDRFKKCGSSFPGLEMALRLIVILNCWWFDQMFDCSATNVSVLRKERYPSGFMLLRMKGVQRNTSGLPMPSDDLAKSFPEIVTRGNKWAYHPVNKRINLQPFFFFVVKFYRKYHFF